jgi:hypothetical protein
LQNVRLSVLKITEKNVMNTILAELESASMQVNKSSEKKYLQILITLRERKHFMDRNS